MKVIIFNHNDWKTLEHGPGRGAHTDGEGRADGCKCYGAYNVVCRSVSGGGYAEGVCCFWCPPQGYFRGHGFGAAPGCGQGNGTG
jgi:hypothetical protein